MTDTANLKELMTAHLGSIQAQLSALRVQQTEGFTEIRKSMERRDDLTDRELRDINARVDGLERTMNRWGGAFALALLIIGVGIPLLIWTMDAVMR